MGKYAKCSEKIENNELLYYLDEKKRFENDLHALKKQMRNSNPTELDKQKISQAVLNNSIEYYDTLQRYMNLYASGEQCIEKPLQNEIADIAVTDEDDVVYPPTGCLVKILERHYEKLLNKILVE